MNAHEYNTIAIWTAIVGIVLAVIGGVLYYYYPTYAVDMEYIIALGVILLIAAGVVYGMKPTPKHRRMRH